MGQASCSDVFKAEEPPKQLQRAAPEARQEAESADLSWPIVRTAPPEPADIGRLRAELQAKEQILQLLRKEAIDHRFLIEVLERETFAKEEALVQLRAAEAHQKELVRLAAEIHQRDEGLRGLKEETQGEQDSLRELRDQAEAKDQLVQDILRALGSNDVPEVEQEEAPEGSEAEREQAAEASAAPREEKEGETPGSAEGWGPGGAAEPEVEVEAEDKGSPDVPEVERDEAAEASAAAREAKEEETPGAAEPEAEVEAEIKGSPDVLEVERDEAAETSAAPREAKEEETPGAAEPEAEVEAEIKGQPHVPEAEPPEASAAPREAKEENTPGEAVSAKTSVTSKTSGGPQPWPPPPIVR